MIGLWCYGNCSFSLLHPCQCPPHSLLVFKELPAASGRELGHSFFFFFLVEFVCLLRPISLTPQPEVQTFPSPHSYKTEEEGAATLSAAA